jgi:hypothetical protein
VAQLTNFLQHYITKASKEGRELFHLSFAEWITEMNTIRKKKSKAGSLHPPLEAANRHLPGTPFHGFLVKPKMILGGHIYDFQVELVGSFSGPVRAGCKRRNFNGCNLSKW